MAITTSYAWTTVAGPIFANTFTSGNQSSVAITSLGGSYFTSWNDTTPPNAVEGRFFRPDTTAVTDESLINSTTANPQFDSSATALANGNVVVSFTDFSVDPLGDVRDRIFTPAGVAVGNDFTVATGNLANVRSDVAGLTNGRFVTVFTTQYGGGDNDIDFTISNADGTPFLSFNGVDTDSNLNTDNASVAGLTGGGYVVAFEQSPKAGGSTSTYFRLFNANGTAVGAKVKIDDVGTINNDVQVTSLADGGFAVAYADNGYGAGTDITLLFFNANGTQRTGFIRANTNTSGDQNKPTLTTLSNGYVVVGWSDSTSLVAQAYTPSGAAVGANYTVAGSVVEGEIAGLSGGVLADSRSSTITDGGSDNSIRTQVDALVRTTTGDTTNSTITGDDLRDVVNGGSGGEVIYGLGGNDTLNGGAGNDNLFGGTGADVLNGGADFDYARYDNAASAVTAVLFKPSVNTGEAAGDTYTSIEGLYGSAFGDNLQGDASGNSIVGNGGDDLIFGLDGGDALAGGAGNDNLWGGTGTDYIDGGADFDYARFDFATAGVTARLDNAGGNTGEATGDYYVNVEGLIGSAYGDILVGDAGGNTIIGLGGNDTIFGQDGNDALVGNDGDDQIYGGAGTDFIDGGTGFNYARYDFAGAGVAVSLATGTGTAGEANGDALTNIQGLVGSFYGDYLVGDANANTIFGQGGNDVIFGGQGADTLYGGAGSDTFAFNASDFQAGIYDRIKDLNNVAGDNDAITLIGVPAAQLQLFDTPSGALITTAALGGNGGVIVEGHTVAQIAPQVFLT